MIRMGTCLYAQTRTHYHFHRIIYNAKPQVESGSYTHSRLGVFYLFIFVNFCFSLFMLVRNSHSFLFIRSFVCPDDWSICLDKMLIVVVIFRRF